MEVLAHCLRFQAHCHAIFAFSPLSSLIFTGWLLQQEYEASLAELRGRNTELEFQVADLTRKAKELADRAVKAEEAQNKLQQVGGEDGVFLVCF